MDGDEMEHRNLPKLLVILCMLCAAKLSVTLCKSELFVSGQAFTLAKNCF